MADDLSKVSFFSRMSARSRMFVLLGGIVGVLFLVYLGTRWLSGGDKTVGPSRVASAPQGLQSVPGGELTPEYYRALMQANSQAAEQAKITGGSAVPTLVNVGGTLPPSANGCVICSDQGGDVKSYLDDWLRQGKISPDDAKLLQDMANKNVSVEEYAAQLDQLVKAGKLTPEQARQLLDQYKKQHTNAVLQDSAKAMDTLIKAGQLPIETANELLGYQRVKMPPTAYAAQLQRLVREGKISPEVAQQLLSQYSQQFTKEVVNRSIATLQQWSRDGQIAPDILKDLIDAEQKLIPADLMAQNLQKYVASGRLAPAVSDKILDEYKQQKEEIGSTEAVSQIATEAEARLNDNMNALVKSGKVSAAAASQLQALAEKDVSPEDYAAAVNALVKQGKISPDVAQSLIDDYNKVKQSRSLAQRLNDLQVNNASPGEYAAELKKAVQAGILTPEQAAQLMREYQAMTSKVAITATNAGAAGSDFAALQQRIQQGAPSAQTVATADQFATAQTQAVQQEMADKAARQEAISTAMSNQAQQLITAWQAPQMVHKARPDTDTTAGTLGAGTGAGTAGTTGSSNNQTDTPVPALIKAGSIIFAVLDTEANSDYPDSPVMATVVDGKYKGSKLVGKLVTTKGVSGQMDRVSLNFTLMNTDAWPASKAVTAYAIDPDTARTVLASSVNYHYMQRFGAIMATSFIQGYAKAITSSSATTTTGIFGTTTTNPQLSPGQKLATALGNVGTALGDVTQNYTNIPPTVRVDSGVSLGILFMADVT